MISPVCDLSQNIQKNIKYFLEKIIALHELSLTRSPISKQFWLFLGSHDQGRLLLKQPQTSPSNQRTLIQLSLTTEISSTNQNPSIIQACNRRNHKGFQLTNIFPFIVLTRLSMFLLQSLYLNFYYANGKTLCRFLV